MTGSKEFGKRIPLWAFRFSNLSDSSEIVLLKKPLEEALATLSKPQIIERQHEGFGVQSHVAKEGSLEVVALGLAHKFVESGFVLASLEARLVRTHSPEERFARSPSRSFFRFVATPMTVRMCRKTDC